MAGSASKRTYVGVVKEGLVGEPGFTHVDFTLLG